jgi:steroid delta-isomerase-like uncharacterized protein
MIDLIKKHLADFSAGNWSEYKADLAPDVVYEERATMQRAKGVDEYLKLIQRWKQAFPDLKATVLDAFASEDRVFAEVEWEGTQSGPLQGPFGTIPATNKHGQVRAALAFRIKDGKIAEEDHYFDLFTLLGQLGIGPSLAARPEQPARPTTQP